MLGSQNIWRTMIKYKKILLINPAYNYNTRSSYPSGGLLSIGTLLQELGCEVKIVHMAADNVGLHEVGDIARYFRPDIVGISYTTFQTMAAKLVAIIVKAATKPLGFEPLVVIGGAHTSALGCKVLGDMPADIAVLGEGERTMAEIVKGKPWAKIKGICFGDTVTEPRPRIMDLDTLPLPNLDLVNLKNFTSPAPPSVSPSMSIMASRGCPAHCGFCSRAVFGNKVSFKSPERVVEEVEYLHKRWGIQEIFFHDDTFNLKRDWILEIFDLIMYKRLNHLHYKAPFRANAKLIDSELLRAAKRAGIWLIFYGVESGNQEMLDRMHKGLKLEEIERAFKLTHEAGIKTTASFIVGYPGETEDTITQSLAFAKKLQPFWAGFSRLTPFPGTEAAEIAKSNGHLLESDYRVYRPDKVLIRTKALDASEIEVWAKRLDGWTKAVKIGRLLANPAMAWQVWKNRR